MRQLKITNNFTIDDPILRRFFNDIKKYEILTPEKEFEIAKKAYIGDINSINKLVNHNMRFVVSVAKQYANKSNLLDLINVGAIGLYKAAEKFDPYKGFKFISFAVFYIRNEILLELSKSSLISIPINLQRDLKKFNKIVTNNLHKFNRNMTLNELLDNAELKKHFSNNDITKLYNLVISVTSYDAEIGENFKLIDIFESNDTTDKNINDENFKQIISDFLNMLSDNEKYIITRYYGIGYNDNAQFSTIADELKLSKNTVLKHYKIALKKLKIKINKSI